MVRREKSVAQLYGPVNTLTPFIHPDYKERFRFMSNRELIRVADQCVEALQKSTCKQVLLIETGAAPFAWVCRQRLKRYRRKLRWHSIKIPRDLQKALFSLLCRFLRTDEKGEALSADCITRMKYLAYKHGISRFQIPCIREEALLYVCALAAKEPFLFPEGGLQSVLSTLQAHMPTVFQQLTNILFEGTAAAKRFQQPTAYFDEYIDSGKTLFNVWMCIGCMVPRPNLSVISYCTYLEQARTHPLVLFTAYDLKDRRIAFRRGVYPFENRVDLIGYFYHSTRMGMSKTTLDALAQRFSSRRAGKEVTQLIQELYRFIRRQNLLTQIKAQIPVKAVKTFVQEDHLVRYLLFCLEKERARSSSIAEFLWLLFDLYGPIWSPLPDAYHLAFWRGFEACPELALLSGWSSLVQRHQSVRAKMLGEIIHACRQRRQVWQENITHLLQVYEYKSDHRYLNGSQRKNGRLDGGSSSKTQTNRAPTT